jgi:hypothetical protein
MRTSRCSCEGPARAAARSQSAARAPKTVMVIGSDSDQDEKGGELGSRARTGRAPWALYADGAAGMWSVPWPVDAPGEGGEGWRRRRRPKKRARGVSHMRSPADDLMASAGVRTPPGFPNGHTLALQVLTTTTVLRPEQRTLYCLSSAMLTAIHSQASVQFYSNHSSYTLFH